MKSLKYFLLIVLSVFLVSSAYKQTYNPDKKFPVKQLQEDFIKPYKNNFKGKVYILINGGELSTTGHFISLVKCHNIRTFIGRESVSTFSCHDNSLRFVLPNTKINGKVARNTFETAVTGLSWEKGIMPDHYVESNLEDLINGVDTIMEYALNLIKHSKTIGGKP
jgi:hypothetical protein